MGVGQIGMIDLRISSLEELTARVEDKARISMLEKKTIFWKDVCKEG